MTEILIDRSIVTFAYTAAIVYIGYTNFAQI